MKNQHGYVPPAYIPLGQSDSEVVHVSPLQRDEQHPDSNGSNQMQPQWSSGICACFDDTQSCMLLPYPVTSFNTKVPLDYVLRKFGCVCVPLIVIMISIIYFKY